PARTVTQGGRKRRRARTAAAGTAAARHQAVARVGGLRGQLSASRLRDRGGDVGERQFGLDVELLSRSIGTFAARHVYADPRRHGQPGSDLHARRRHGGPHEGDGQPGRGVSSGQSHGPLIASDLWSDSTSLDFTFSPARTSARIWLAYSGLRKRALTN